MTAVFCAQRRRPQGRDLGEATGPVRPPGVRRLRRRQGDRQGGRATSPQARRDDPEAPALEHGLDVFHTAMEARRVLARHWRRAEAAWERGGGRRRSRSPRRSGKGIDARGVAQAARAAWRRATAAFEQVERLEAAWGRARAALDLFRRRRPAQRPRPRRGRDRRGAGGPDRPGLVEGPQLPDATARSLAFLDRMHRRLESAEPRAGVARGDGLAVVAAAPPADVARTR